MNTHYFEVKTFRNGRASGILPSTYPSREDAVSFAKHLKRLYAYDASYSVRIYEVTEIDF